jgi:ubiquitin fusion degradation protein 1
VTLPKATFVKFRAQSVDFLEILNPKVALEVTLRKFTCLTVGEMIQLEISRKVYQLEVVELKPGEAASIIETDCELDFAEPVGYVEPKRVTAAEAAGGGETKTGGSAVRVPQKGKAESDADKAAFKPFTGQAKRIDGKGESKESKDSPASSSSSSSSSSYSSSSSSSSSATPSASTAGVFVGVGRTLAASSSSGSTGAAAGAGAAAPKANTSRIGDQFSKKKLAVSAFTGPAKKLGGP